MSGPSPQPPADPRPILAELLGGLPHGRRLDEAAARSLFEGILSGALEPAQIGAALALIAARGPGLEELVAGAKAMRQSLTPVPVPPPPAGQRQIVLDTCGTGGAPKRMNISTAAAIVAAAASPHRRGGMLRVLVAKHGNRSRTGRGSAEVLERLGVRLDAPAQIQSHIQSQTTSQTRCLAEAGICFCFAVQHHPAMKHAAGPRRALGFPTIFNLLGPLTNPAGATHQVVGVSSAGAVGLIAEALSRLGASRAMVLHADDGSDELMIDARSTIARVEAGTITTERLDPAALGFAPAPAADAQAEDLDQAAHLLSAVLAGSAGAAREIVVLNAAAAVLTAGIETDWPAAIARACESIDSGRARSVLSAWIEASRKD